MSSDVTELGRLATGLDELRDLFRRRLLDDRDKRLLIEQLGERAERAESRRESVLLVPLVRQLMLVIDRMDQAAADDELMASCVDELSDVLAQHGFEMISGVGTVDPSCHELLAIDGDGGPVSDKVAWTDLEISRVVRRGVRFEGRVLRPTQVIARHRPSIETPRD